ncbi:MAG TPA: Ig-like domain-containing protein [Roseiflexaceae bacterium]|nr:Ig-like domain-containing protein [Roseiflexaceae bacterium]
MNTEPKTQNSKLTIALIAVAVLVVVVLGLLFGPLALRGPAVTEISPVDGEAKANPKAPIRVVFDQWVRPESVASAVTVDPPARFSVTADPNTPASPWGSAVLITPEDGLEYGARYRVTIGAGAANLLGRTLAQPHSIAFATVPYVSVATVGPQDGSADVELRAPITVEFAAPVVTAEQIAAAADDPSLADRLPQPLSLVPEAKGVGRWLSPTLFGFYPEEDLRAATTYTATLPADISPDGQARMEQPVSWRFSTAAPLLEAARPFPGATEVPASAPVEVRLARDVDIDSAGGSFSMVEAETGAAVTGSIQPIQGGFRFQPAAALQRNLRYEVRLGPGIRSSHGAVLNSAPVAWSFSTIGDLEVAQVEPPVDAQEVLTSTRRISVRFNHPVVALVADGASQPSPLTITPAVQGVGRWLDTSTYVFSPTAGLEPSTDYRVQIAAGLKDQTGGELRQPYEWGFRTVTPQILGVRPAPDAFYAAPDSSVLVVFNQPMDMDALRGALRLTRADTGADVPFSLSGAPGALPSDPEVYDEVVISGFLVRVTPDAPLERGVRYALNIAQGARATRGGTLSSAYTQIFRVAPLPALLSSEPANGVNATERGGSVELTFSAPMDWPSVERSLTIEPKPTNIYTSSTNVVLYVHFAAQPETNYRVTVGAGARDRFGVALNQATTISYRTAPLGPSLGLIGPSRLAAYNAYAPTRVPIRYVNLSTVQYRIWKLAPARVPMLIGDYATWESFRPDGADLLREERAALRNTPNQENVGLLELGRLEAGLYYLEVRAGGLADRQVMAVSPYTLTIKRSPNRAFIWAVDLSTGQPVKNLALLGSSFDYSNAPGPQASEPRELGRTDADGILKADLDQSNASSSLFLWSSQGPLAFGSSIWGDGISPWDYGLPADYENRQMAGSISTDRPIYRPEQNVYIRGAIRMDRDGSYSLPDQQRRARLTINDPNGTTVLSTTLALSPFGTFNTTLPLERGAKLGSYSLMAEIDGAQLRGAVFGSFTVAEYRKPTFEITVTPAKPDLVQGEALSFDVSTRYFSGGALANAPVRWRLLASPLYFSPETASTFRFEDLDDAYTWYRWFDNQPNRGGERVADGEARTDAQGRLTIPIPAGLGKEGRSRRLTLDVDVTDIDGNVLSSQGGANVHAGAFYIGMRPEGYVTQVGQPQQVALITLDPQGQPVPNRPLTVGIYQREWYSVKEQGSDGRFYWTSSYTDTLVETKQATTDAQGRSSVSFTPSEAGSYRIGAEGRDDGGRTVKASAFSWVYGGDTFWGIDDTARVDLIADKDRYKPGETASILVTAPYKGMRALMTIERGEVLEHRLLSIAGTTEVLQVPITADYAPNVYVSLVLLKPAGEDAPVPDLRVGLVNLPISTEQQELNISITPDKEQAGPGEAVSYTIKATDYSGKPVQAEVGLALVDKAVLSLADDPNPTLRQAFYEKRPLAVFTSQSLTALVDRTTLKLQPGAKGGGGGQAAEVLVRRNFPDTAYWNPSLVTAADGTASVTVELPDSLTTWRLSARAITADTLVGQTISELVATRPLLVRPSLPRFLTAGDQLTLQAVLQNNTAGPIEATVTLRAAAAPAAGEGAASPVQIQDAAEQRVSVPANGTALVRWRALVGAPEGKILVDRALLTFEVSGGGQRDAVEQILPVQRFTTPEVVASAGQVRDTTVETIQGPADTTQGELLIELTPSLAAGLETGLGYLRDYPYLCVEQTVSRFLPNAVTSRLFKQFGVSNSEAEAGLAQSISAGLQRLIATQQLDGGWGWWSSDASDPYLTAYVIQGLLEARQAGYDVDQQVLDRALAFLKGSLDSDQTAQRSPYSLLNMRSYGLYVLALAGQPDRGRTIALYEQRAQLAIYGRAYLLMTLKRLGNEDVRVKTLVADLMGTAIMHTADAHWEEREPDHWNMSSNQRTTALALQALLQADPENFLVPNAVRYLMVQRRDGHWESTQASSMALLALADYLDKSGELKANYSYRAALNGSALSEGQVTRDTLRQTIEAAVPLAQLTTGQPNQLELRRQGDAGRLYYTLRLRTYQDAAQAEAQDQGIGIQRVYSAVDTQTLSPTGQLVSEAKVGDLVQVRLTISAPEDLTHLAVEDMLPAGLEPLDTSLRTTSAAARAPELRPADGALPYWWYFGQTEIHDNRVALFATHLPKGTYEYTYLARVVTPGTFQTLPALAYQMYQPEVFGRSAGTTFTAAP